MLNGTNDCITPVNIFAHCRLSTDDNHVNGLDMYHDWYDFQFACLSHKNLPLVTGRLFSASLSIALENANAISSE